MNGISMPANDVSEPSSRKSTSILTSSMATSADRSGSPSQTRQHLDQTMLSRASRRSLQPSEQSSDPQSSSTSSSRTGSETIGQTSPIVSQNGFQTQVQHNEMQSPSRRHTTRLTEAGSSSFDSTRSSPGTERTRRSELHERDVTQLRSESRLGSRIDDDDAANRSRDSGLHKYSPRKSTSLVNSSNYLAEDNTQELPRSLRQTRETHEAVISTGRRAAEGLTDAALRSAGDLSPAEFRLPDKEKRRAYRAAHTNVSSDSDDNSELKQSSKAAVTTRGVIHSDSTRLRRRKYPYSAAADNASQYSSSDVRRASQAAAGDSIDSLERSRKDSTSSGRSQKSANSASDLHRAVSRASILKAQNRDSSSAQDDNKSLIAFRRSDSPSGQSERSYQANASGEINLFPERSPHTPNRALEDLRLQIEDLHISRSGSKSNSNDHRISSGARSSLGLRKSAMDPLRLQQSASSSFTPVASDRLQRFPSTEPPRSRVVLDWNSPQKGLPSDAVHRINDLVGHRPDSNTRRSVPLRSSTSMGTVSDRLAGSEVSRHAAAADKEPAPIKNMTIRFEQLESLYSKLPTADGALASEAGPQTSRMVELMGAVVKGTASMWSELSRMQPIATEGHLMGVDGDSATSAFGQLDEGFAFLSKLTLEQARAVQDLLFLMDRMEKERQIQFNKVLQELGHSPRPFSRVGNGVASITEKRAPSSLSRAGASTRGIDDRLRSEFATPLTGSPFARGERGATLTASQLRSMTSLGHTSSHSRSASELSPSSSAALRRVHRTRPSENFSVPSILPPKSARESDFFTPMPSEGVTESRDDTNAQNSATASRPPPSFTPRRSRLSNPSVSNATASYQPSAASVSPDASMSGMQQLTGSEDSTGKSETDDLGRVSRQSSAVAFPRSNSTTPQDFRSHNSQHISTLRGESSDQRVVDTLASQLHNLGRASAVSTSPTAISNEMGSHRRFTKNTDLLTMRDGQIASQSSSTSHKDGLDEENRSSGPPTHTGLTKSPKPPRPPRNVHRQSDESLSSLSGMLPFGRDILTNASLEGARANVGSTNGVQSLGQAASRRITRMLGQQTATPHSLEE